MAFAINRVVSWLLGLFELFSWLLEFVQVFQLAFEILGFSVGFLLFLRFYSWRLGLFGFLVGFCDQPSCQLAFGVFRVIQFAAFVFEKYQVSCFWCVLRQCILNQFGSDAKKIVISDLKIFLKNTRNVLFTRFSCVELICLLNTVNLSSL